MWRFHSVWGLELQDTLDTQNELFLTLFSRIDKLNLFTLQRLKKHYHKSKTPVSQTNIEKSYFCSKWLYEFLMNK